MHKWVRGQKISGCQETHALRVHNDRAILSLLETIQTVLTKSKNLRYPVPTIQCTDGARRKHSKTTQTELITVQELGIRVPSPNCIKHQQITTCKTSREIPWSKKTHQSWSTEGSRLKNMKNWREQHARTGDWNEKANESDALLQARKDSLRRIATRLSITWLSHQHYNDTT